MSASYDYCLLKPSTPVSREQADLHNQCWYHGLIKRVEVLRLLKDEGDFLVRDSISHPGGYVLTGFCNFKPVHFEINRSEEGLFHFEDEKFGCIVDLIEFYHAHRKEITSASGFILGSPVLNSKSTENKWTNVARMEDSLELEAAYAPYYGKARAKAPSLQTLNRVIGHRAVLNEAKKRWKDQFKSEEDIYHRLLAFSDDNTKENHDNQETNRKHEEQSCELDSDRPKDETHDYCEMDYEAMVEEHHQREESFQSIDLKRRYSSSSSHILLDASSSLDLSASCSTTLYSKVSSQSSNHLPFCCPPPIPSIGLVERAQSCHTLINQPERANTISNNNTLVRCESKKIDPAPLLPVRISLNLGVASCNSVNKEDGISPSATEEEKQVDYDEISACEYTRLPHPKKPLTPPKPTLAKLKALNQMGKELRYFVKTLCNTPSYRLAVWMSEEDCRVFRLMGDNIGLLEVFLEDDTSKARQHIADRLSLSQAAVRLSIQKSPNTPEVLEAWIRLAAFLLLDLGNAFSFGNILAVLLKHHLALKMLKMNTYSTQLLQERLLPAYKQMCQPSNSPTDYLLPFIQPYLHFFSDYVHPNLTKAIHCSENFSERLALLCSFMKVARKMVCSEKDYQKRATQLVNRTSKEHEYNEENIFSNDYLKILGSG